MMETLISNTNLSPVSRSMRFSTSAMNNFYYIITYFFIVPGVLGIPLFRTNKLSLATWESYYQRDHKGPGTYAFGYDIEDPASGNIQFRQEERHLNGTVSGNYGYVDDNGKPHIVTYVSDERGYRATVEVEGEPTQYFPKFYNHEKNFHPLTLNRREKQYSEFLNRDLNENHVDFGYLPSSNNVHFQSRPIFFGANFPSYFRYARLNEVQK